MRFKVVPFQHGSQRDDAVLQGIAHGFGEMYPVPDHPSGVQRMLSGTGKPSGDAKAQLERTQVQRSKVRVSQRG